MTRFSHPAILILSAFLTALLCQSPLPAGKKSDLDSLAGAIKQVVEAKSYTFSATETPSVDTKGGVTAKYQQGKPLWCKADQLECFKQGHTVVYRKGDDWLKSKTGIESDPLIVLGSIAKVRQLRLPGDDLAAFVDVGKAAEGLKVANESKGAQRCTFSKIKGEALKKLTPTQYAGVVTGGQIEFLIDADGLRRYEIKLRLQGRIGNAEIDGYYTRTVTLTELNKTAVEVPAKAAALLK